MSGASIGHTAVPPRPRRTLHETPSNLPRPLTSFVGREQELAEATLLLASSRLLTLTGPGGSGKTRLCIRLAAEVADDFPDGVFFVPLAPVRGAELVPSSIAQHIGLQDSRGRPLLEHLAAHLRERRVLIVLDNFEHLLAAGPVVVELLNASRALHVVVSSRSSLRVSGEQEWPVPPLALPGPQTTSAEAIAGCESVRLFVERAASAMPGFAVDDKNAASVAQIVQQLDGLPLAIELAAARIKLLPPEAILARLDHALRLLVGGDRDLPDRQQTLRSTISWSYELLSESARRLLAACSVFRGGADLEMIESVCEMAMEIGMPVLDGLEELVDQSLMRPAHSSGPPRYTMLETIREFAAERLAELPEAAGIQESHAAAFLALAEEAGSRGAGSGEKERLDRLQLEQNNLRAAVEWYGRESPADALRLAAAISAFWSVRGHFTEGRDRLRGLLDVVTEASRTRVRALNGAANLAIDQGEHGEAARLLEESLAMSRSLNYPAGHGMAALYLARSRIASMQAVDALPVLGEAMASLHEAHDEPGIALCLMFSGLMAQFTDQPGLACDRFNECIRMARELGIDSLGARASQLLGIARLDLGELGRARTALEQGLPVALDLGDRFVVPIGLGGFASLAARTGRPRQALRLAGAAAAYSETNHFSVPPVMQALLDRALAPVRNTLGTGAAKLFEEGRRMKVEEAVASALADEPEEAWRPGPRRTLTRREVEVASLVAGGLTNREIAGRLHLSVRTVDVHVDHILTKLGFHTRTQLVAWAYEQEIMPKNT